jgi:hypothetical protein
MRWSLGLKRTWKRRAQKTIELAIETCAKNQKNFKTSLSSAGVVVGVRVIRDDQESGGQADEVPYF